MQYKNGEEKTSNDPIRIRLELTHEYLSDYQKRMLKRYGESSTGESIIRDILIPRDMPLHNLHYAIQKLYGWRNSHLRRFYLPQDRFKKLTNGTVKGWSDLVGVVFQPPSIGEDMFWDDDYERGNFNFWLRKKYTGPYYYGGQMENILMAKRDVKELLDTYKMMEVKESFEDYFKRQDVDENTTFRTIRKAPLINMTIEEMYSSIILDSDPENLLERLEVNQVIASENEDLDTPELFPITRELIYNYDFGDNWEVKITKFDNCHDLLEENHIGEDELEEAINTVIEKHKPVCIHKDGLSVMDDTGGLPGYADILGVIFEGEDREEKSSMTMWSKDQGWSTKKVPAKTLL